MKKHIKTLFAKRQYIIAALILALLFATAVTFVTPLYYHSSISQFSEQEGGWWIAAAQSLGLAVPLFFLILLLLVHGGTFFTWLGTLNPLKKLTLSWKKRSVFAVAGIILLLWLPWIIIYYPGSMPYDPVAQIYQIHGSGAFRPELWEPTVDGWISNSHPILHTLILGGFFELGDALGSQNLGIFMYSIFQCLVRALSFAAVCCFLRRLGVPKIFCLLTIAFFALFPAIATSSMVTFKDHLFSPIYVIYLMQVIEIVRTRGVILKKKSFLIGFCAATLLMPLLKHPGMYIVLVAGIILAIVYRKYFKQLLLSVAIPVVVVYAVFPLLLFPALQVVPAGSQDMFGPFFAQTARVIHDNPDAMSAEEREIIDKVVPYRVMATGYSTVSTDYIKGNFRQDSTWPERLDYFALWLKQGFQYPKEYLEGFFTLQATWIVPTHGWDVHDNLYPNTAQRIVDTVGHNNRLPVNKAKEVREQLYFDGPSELYSAKYFMRQTFLYLHNVPVIGFLFTNACYTFFLPFILFAVVFLRKKRFLPVFIPVALTFAVLLISPMDMSRYALPMLESTPLIFGLAILAWMYPEERGGSGHCARIANTTAESLETDASDASSGANTFEEVDLQGEQEVSP